MDIKQLRYFLGVLEAKSITRAAEVLHIAQPAIGMQLRKLEEELGVKLLVRHSRGVVATEAGERLKMHAKSILRNLDVARQDVTEIDTEPRGQLSLGMTTNGMQLIFASIIRACMQKYPAISLNCTEGISERLSESLVAGRLDLALTYSPPIDSGFVVEPLALESLYLAVPAGHPLATASDITFREALKCDLIATAGFSLLATWREQIAVEYHITPRIICEVGSVSMIKELVRRGVGCSITPRGAMLPEAEENHIVTLPITDSTLTRTLYMACSKKRRNAKVLETVYGEIRSAIDERIAAGTAGWKVPPGTPGAKAPE